MTHAPIFQLDTDICIHLLNGNEQVKQRVAQVGVDTLAVAMPAICELYFGAYNSSRVDENVRRVREFIEPPGPLVLTVDETAAEIFGQVRTDLRRTGQPLDDMDLLIASVALAHGLTLVTNNTSHFQRIPRLSLDNWLLPVQG